MYHNELYHHGILGQKWGKRNGPPYPLDRDGDNHSNSEKKAGWRSSLKKKSKLTDEQAGNVVYNVRKKKNERFNLTDNQKKALMIGAAVAGGLLVSYGAIKMSQAIVGKKVPSLDALEALKTESVLNMSISDQVQTINPYFSILPGSTTNCAYCTTAYELRRRGYDVVADLDTFMHNGTITSGLSYDDITSFYKTPRRFTSFPNIIGLNSFNKIIPEELETTMLFKIDDSTARKEYCDAVKKVLLNLGDGARGNLCGRYDSSIGGGHSIIFEVMNGKVQLMDAQIGHVYEPDEIYEAIKYFRPYDLKFLQTNDLELNDNVLNFIRDPNSGINMPQLKKISNIIKYASS